MNYSDKQTEEKLNKLEKDISSLYRKAYSEVNNTSAKYMAQFTKRDEEMREALNDPEAYKKKYCVGASAEMTPKEHYKQWRLAQIGRGKRWEAVKKNIAEQMVVANEKAADLINGKTAGIYVDNYNYSAYEIEKGSGIAFNLVNEDAIDELLRGENHTGFRTVRVNPKRDYNWNSKRIQNALTSGILQGKSIDKLSNSFMEVMGNNKKAAIRNARTAVTSAQNAGRLKSYEDAEEMGIECRKMWVATLDSRTRDSHAELDGEIVGIDEEFSNGLSYPGDPAGDPAEVYNCRCTMRSIGKYTDLSNRQRAYKVNDRRVFDSDDSPTTFNGTYNDWLKAKGGSE